VSKRTGKLSVKGIDRLTAKGRYGDGRGLYLQVVPGANGLIRSWLFRYKVGGRERTMGFGPLDDVSLDQAREMASQQRGLLRQGRDPVTERDDQRAKHRAKSTDKAKTFAEVVDLFFRAHSPKWKSERHARQFLATLQTYANPILGPMRVADIDRNHVLAVLTRDDFWTQKTETALRVRGRIEAVLDFAKVNHWRAEGENPATWDGNLQHALPPPNKISKTTHYAALPWQELPGFVGELKTRRGTAALALQFTILTAARTGEVISAEWSEIDFDNRVWTRPADHMKAGQEHRVPLSDAAMQILKSLPREDGNPHVFIGTRRGSGISNMTMTELMRRTRADITVHGFRSTFKDWASETTSYSREVTEMALAHAIGSKVEAAYRRGDLYAKRCRLMADWASYCTSPARTGAVIPINQPKLAQPIRG
jgi:integrase